MSARMVFISVCALFAAIFLQAAGNNVETISFDDPIDALSIGTKEELNGEVSFLEKDGWSEWHALEIDDEQDPLSNESNLVISEFPSTKIKLRNMPDDFEVHPISVSHEPSSYQVAALSSPAPKILSRKQWGADESLLYRKDDEKGSNAENEEADTGGGATSGRISDCELAQQNFPNEFKTTRTVKEDANGTFRWPQSYSDNVRMLVVHHTAIKVEGDARPGVERVRALYAYHANNRGWGDIGYHYLIDETGQVYEGRAGGEGVVGGHAYCANIGSIGVSLLGNFDVEKPTQVQMQSLQSLLAYLGDKYSLDLSKNVSFHGKTLPTIVRHSDVVSTSCPGYYVRETIGQIRSNVIAGNTSATIRFPTLASRNGSAVEERRAQRMANQPAQPSGPTLNAVGSTELSGPPGSQATFMVNYTAGAKTIARRARIAEVERSNARIGIWQALGTSEMRVRKEILLPNTLPANDQISIRMRVQFPTEPGTYTVKLGSLSYTLTASGRRVTSPTASAPSTGTPQPSASQSSRSSRSSSRSLTQTPAPIRTLPIRIRLGFTGEMAQLTSTENLKINRTDAQKDVTIYKAENNCSVAVNGTAVTSSIVRFDPGSGIIKINNWNVATNRFRGVIECRVIDGALVLINELPLEDYMAGLAEEPDTEPYEKQRAFAIAARSYAAHYMDSKNRKFPGMPYDGNDSPATFQKYGGVAFEEKNPRWVQAVRATEHLVIMKENQVVKTPYFSSNDGRTKTPDEAGWKNFPFAEVFSSKPDPWCKGFSNAGHGVGMSGCGSEAQANEGKTAEEILMYYYPTTSIASLLSR